MSDVCCILSGLECVGGRIDKQEVGRQLACEGKLRSGGYAVSAWFTYLKIAE